MARLLGRAMDDEHGRRKLIAGTTIAQACQTGPRSLITAAFEVGSGQVSNSLVVTCDRMSNGAFVTYPGDGGWGGLPKTKSWTIDNFLEAPDLGHPVMQTAENVATRWQISREEQHDVVLLRYDQYQDALANNQAFQRGYMSLPFDVPDAGFKKTSATINGDIGVTSTSREALDRLMPVHPNGTVSYASQTHPADGNAALIVSAAEKAGKCLPIRGCAFVSGDSAKRAPEPALMPVAPVPAARIALERAGLAISDIKSVKSHNPFVVNDIVFARETGFPVEKMNNYGSSLIFGHPQGPTGTRLMIELIEELVIRGGGTGLYHGCAAGDVGFAVIIEVDDRPAH